MYRLYPIYNHRYLCLTYSSSYEQREVIDITEKVGKRHLFEGHPADAIPAALQYMHCTSLLHGPTSVNLSLSYTMLAEASVGKYKLQC